MPEIVTLPRMRRLASIPDGPIRRIILYEESDGSTYLFLIDQDADVGCFADEWFENAELAETRASELGVRPRDWKAIEDPRPGCQHDFVAPVRVVGRESAEPEWGKLEHLDKDGQWVPFTPPAR